jgi:hypothetical protein
MIINRSVWQMSGQLWPVIAGRASLDVLESDDAPPAPECAEYCPHVPRETSDPEDDDA